MRPSAPRPSSGPTWETLLPPDGYAERHTISRRLRFMPRKRPPDVPAAEITPRALFTRRNVIMGALAAATPLATGAAFRAAFYPKRWRRNTRPFDVPLHDARAPELTTSERP